MQLTDPEVRSRVRVIKKADKDGVYTALDVGLSGWKGRWQVTDNQVTGSYYDKKNNQITRAFCRFRSLLTFSVFAANVGAAEVTADVLNFRSAPSTNGQILDAAYKGEKVLVLEALESGWRGSL